MYAASVIAGGFGVYCMLRSFETFMKLFGPPLDHDAIHVLTKLRALLAECDKQYGLTGLLGSDAFMQGQVAAIAITDNLTEQSRKEVLWYYVFYWVQPADVTVMNYYRLTRASEQKFFFKRALHAVALDTFAPQYHVSFIHLMNRDDNPAFVYYDFLNSRTRTWRMRYHAWRILPFDKFVAIFHMSNFDLMDAAEEANREYIREYEYIGLCDGTNQCTLDPMHIYKQDRYTWLVCYFTLALELDYPVLEVVVPATLCGARYDNTYLL